MLLVSLMVLNVSVYFHRVPHPCFRLILFKSDASITVKLLIIIHAHCFIHPGQEVTY